MFTLRTKFAPGTVSRTLAVSREAGIVASGQIVATAGSLASVRVLTAMLHPSQYGELALGLTVAGLAQQLVMGPISVACLRYFAPAKEMGYLSTYIRASTALVGAGTFLLLVAWLIVGYAMRSLGHAEWMHLQWPVFVYAWTSSLSSILDGLQNAARQRAVVAAHQAAGAWLRLALVFWLLHARGGAVEAALWGQSAGFFLLMITQALFLRRTLLASGFVKDSSGVGSVFRTMWKYAWPFSTWGPFTWAQTASDRWALDAFSGVRQVGLYQSIYQIGYNPIALFTQFVLQLSVPILFARVGAGTNEERNRSAEQLNKQLVRVVLGATALLGIASFAGGHKLLALLLAPAYRSQSGLISPLIVAGGIFSAGQLRSVTVMSSMVTKRLIAPKIVTAVAGALLNCVGARLWGTRGVVGAQLGFSLFYLGWIFALSPQSQPRKPSAIGIPQLASR